MPLSTREATSKRKGALINFREMESLLVLFSPALIFWFVLHQGKMNIRCGMTCGYIQGDCFVAGHQNRFKYRNFLQ